MEWVWNEAHGYSWEQLWSVSAKEEEISMV
jgi:hypothetical protein